MVTKIQRRGLLIIISDLFGDVEQLLKALAHFRHAKHEMIIFQIWDPDELDFPFRQWTQFSSLETATDDISSTPLRFAGPIWRSSNSFARSWPLAAAVTASSSSR